MAEYTQNYNLEKQQGNDFVDVNGINGNFDIIDSKIKEVSDSIPDNVAYLESIDETPEPEIPMDSDLLGGQPKSYFEQLIDNVSSRVVANLTSINTINISLKANTSTALMTSDNLLASLTTPEDSVRRYEYTVTLPSDIPPSLISPTYLHVELIGLGCVRIIKITSVTSGGGIEHIDGYLYGSSYIWSSKY